MPYGKMFLIYRQVKTTVLYMYPQSDLNFARVFNFLQEFFISPIYLSIYFVLLGLFSSHGCLLMFYEKHLFFHPLKDTEQSPNIFFLYPAVVCIFRDQSLFLNPQGGWDLSFLLFSSIFSRAPFFFSFYLLGLNETKPSAWPHTVCLGDNSILFLDQQLERRLV